MTEKPQKDLDLLDKGIILMFTGFILTIALMILIFIHLKNKYAKLEDKIIGQVANWEKVCKVEKDTFYYHCFYEIHFTDKRVIKLPDWYQKSLDGIKKNDWIEILNYGIWGIEINRIPKPTPNINPQTERRIYNAP